VSGAILALTTATLALVGPSASAEADAASGDSETSVRYSPRGGPKDRDKWIYRWAPTRHMVEVGAYGGVWFPNKNHELYAPQPGLPDLGWQRMKIVTPEVGLRAGYYPLRFLGIEAEGGVMPTRTRSTDARVTAWTLRGHVVGQLGLWSVTPFLLAGVGILGTSGDAPPAGLGTEQDVAIHFGGGVKAYLNRWIQLRLDVRNVAANRRGVGEGLASNPEILLGISVTLGRGKKKKAARPGIDDRDGDGVLDHDDYCPDVYGEAPRGCPQVCVDDSDGDGIPDPVDKCPLVPETRNGFEDEDGCPDEVPPEYGEVAGIMKGITFDTDRDTIKAESEPTIDRAVEIMKKYPALRVRIIGHTDDQGSYRHNQDLSRRRAESVKRYMVGEGLDPSRLETAGAGPDQPIDTNATPAGRANNRRIEFQILDEGGAPVTTESTTPVPTGN
jgi:outer membrane protein OmpA-like peptidoglycan-associated protein